MAEMADYGAFAALGPLLILHDRVRAAALDRGACSVSWLLPDDVLGGVTEAYGIPVERIAGVEPGLVLRPIESKRA